MGSRSARRNNWVLRKLGQPLVAEVLDPSYLPVEAPQAPAPPGKDLVAHVFCFEIAYVMQNPLLRDTVAEIRLPLLDRRMMDLAYLILGKQGQPARRSLEHLLRRALAVLLGPAVLSLKKLGFWLPIQRWMAGPLRQRCEASCAHRRTTGVVRATRGNAVWQHVLAGPEPFGWAAPWGMFVLGTYLGNLTGGTGAAGPAA